jgi:DNA polymerase III epsilon subunit-like protein
MIKMNKTIYCTLDSETVGGASTPTGMYNLGCTIHDKDGHIFATCSMLVMEHYDEIRFDDYAKKNFHLYEERLARGEMSAVATEEEAVSIVRNLCHFYGVRYVMAFNTGFDFCKTICRQLLDEFEFIDLWLMAVQTICHQKGYAKFCRENGFKSSSGKSCATSAESVYAYITNNPDYTEEHTALNDALIEMEIFVKCLSLHKKFTKNIHNFDAKGKEYNKCFPKWAE